MANYTKIVDYAAKDALNTGDPVKLVKGTELGAEYDAIAVAIATKANTASPAFTGVSSFAVGAVGAPSIYMTGYTTTGWYNIGANNWGFAVSGAKVLDISSTGLAVTGTLSATSALTLSGTGQLLIATAASADDKYATISNTNGTLEYGVLAGGEGFIGTSTADNLRLQVNGSVVGNLSSTGLAVTGAISATTNTNNLYEAVTLTNSSNTSAGMQILTKNGYGNLVSIDMQQVDNGTGADDGVMNIKIATNSTLSTVASISSTGLAVTGAISATTTIKTGGYTVATLPAGTVGMRAYVTDATAPTYNGALTGGGAVTVPVFYNGSAWVSA